MNVSVSKSFTPNRENRRAIERLSGWRLNLFFVLLVINTLGLVAIISLPMVLDLPKFKLLKIFVVAVDCVLLTAVAGFRFPVSVKLALGGVFAVVCIWALRSVGWALGSLSITVFDSLLLVLFQTIVITTGGALLARRFGFHSVARFSVKDILILVSAFAILFPLALTAWPQIPTTDGWRPMFFNELAGDSQYLAAFWQALLNGAWCLVIVNLYFGLGKSKKDWQVLLLPIVALFFGAALIHWDSFVFSLGVAVWVAISLLPIFAMRAAGTQ